ncbi:MAG: hypothetical protein AB7R40_23030 [Nitrospiraceae bacterium]
MSKIPCIAVIIEGGIVQETLIENWPDQQPLPLVVVVDYDTDGADETSLTEFAIGDDVVEAICYADVPNVYETFDRPALSPSAVLSALTDGGSGD